MKHKHCELIKAWADGADIEFRQSLSQAWVSVKDPVWAENTEYRIKPAEKIVRWQWIMKTSTGRIYVYSDLLSEAEMEQYQSEFRCCVIGKAEWTRMEFDE